MSAQYFADTLHIAVQHPRIGRMTVRMAAILAHMTAAAERGRIRPWGTDELAQVFGFRSKAVVTRAVQKMQRQHLVTNETNPKDQRKRLIWPTPEGFTAIHDAAEQNKLAA
jgi:DNA-binding MarR family transcriptional regulator